MLKLEDLQPNAAVRGILPDALITVVSVQWFASEALELTYKALSGRVANEPLRFLLADDPGAGQTIMAGLLIKELIARGDLQRCLIVCPGSLAEQWQDELDLRFHLPFEILTNEKLESAELEATYHQSTSQLPMAA